MSNQLKQAMEKETILNVGFDDTDSPKGMCTTFLAYKIVDSSTMINSDWNGMLLI